MKTACFILGYYFLVFHIQQFLNLITISISMVYAAIILLCIILFITNSTGTHWHICILIQPQHTRNLDFTAYFFFAFFLSPCMCAGHINCLQERKIRLKLKLSIILCAQWLEQNPKINTWKKKASMLMIPQNHNLVIQSIIIQRKNKWNWILLSPQLYAGLTWTLYYL